MPARRIAGTGLAALLLAAPLVFAAPPGEEQAAGPASPPARPDVILISIDTLRPDHLGAYGYERDTSPTLAGIARDGVRFTRAFSQAPWTIPSHASLLSGRYPCAHGANTRSAAISGSVRLLAEVLHETGYRTAGFVNAPYLGAKFGFDRGFEVYENRPADVGSLTWLDDVGDAPFFLFLHYMSVHGPYKGRPEDVRRFLGKEPATGPPDSAIAFLRGTQIHEYLKLERYASLEHLVAQYDAGILALDRRLAPIVAELRRRGAYDDAIVVVTSDHGESLFDHRIFVGHGMFLYDDEIRVPLIVKPGRVRPAGAVVDDVVQSVDVVPTVLELLGLPPPGGIDGESLVPLIRTGKPVRDDGIAMGISSAMGDMAYLRTSRWKYIGPSGHSLEKVVGFFKPSAREVLASRVTVGEQLFDLTKDPGERTNVAAAHPEIAAGMRSRLDAILSRCKAGPEPGEEVTLDEEELKRLEALGYVD